MLDLLAAAVPSLGGPAEIWQHIVNDFSNITSPSAFAAFLQVLMIDIVLAGDNAIVIALAARNLPPTLQKRAILWGTFGAIAVRSLMTLAVVWMLRLPGLLLFGGLLLVPIALKLLTEDEPDDSHDISQGFTLPRAA